MHRTHARLRIALQKDGRLAEWSATLLQQMGLQFETYKRRLISRCRNEPIDLLFLRDDDIPSYVHDGVVHCGIVGENVVLEHGVDVDCVRKLEFGYCTLQIAAPAAGPIRAVADLHGVRIATSYPHLLGKFLAQHQVTAEIVTVAGGVEIAPQLDVADAICDLVSTGSTLELHSLTSIATVTESQAVWIAHRNGHDAERQRVLDRLLVRLDGVLHARAKKYVMMNAPMTAVPQLKKIIAGQKSPTIVPLADPALVAVHAVVAEDFLWETLEQLRHIGATDILVMTIEKMIA